LKQDQFKFLYETIQIVFKSALVKWMIIKKPEPEIDHEATAELNGDNQEEPEEGAEPAAPPAPVDPAEIKIRKIVYKPLILDADQKRFFTVFKKVIPKLVAFKTLVRMKNIKEGKKNILTKEIERLEDQGHPYQMAKSMAMGTWKEPEPEVKEEEEVKGGSPGKGALFGIAAEKAAEEAEKKKKELEEQQAIEEEERKQKEDFERWGRYWTWESYFNEEN
jgi:hypothetical protein